MENVVKMLKSLWWLLIAMLLIYIMNRILAEPLNGLVGNMVVQAKAKTITAILFVIVSGTALFVSVSYLVSTIPKEPEAPTLTTQISCQYWMRDDRGYMRICDQKREHQGPHTNHAFPRNVAWEGMASDAHEVKFS